jgi:SAM-dependent methyltransferase
MNVIPQPAQLGAQASVEAAPRLVQPVSLPEVQSPEPEAPSQGEPLHLEPADCCICGHDDALPVGVGEDFEYRSSPDQFLAMRCRECGVVYLKLRPATSELARIYPPNYHAFDFSSERFGLAHRVRRWLEARRLLPWCRALPRGGRVLDVGCGDGFHLGLLREFGSPDWELEGVDASEWAVNAGRARGLTLHLGTVQDVSLPAASYDLALLIATIEHVDDPAGVLKAVHSLLRPGGRVVVVTDNTDTWSFRLFATRHWGGYHFPRHWNLFDGRNLRRLASATGFEVEALSTIVSPVNWTYSVHNALVDRGAPAWLVNRFTLASPVSLAVFTVFDWAQQLLGRGGLLRAVLRKPLSTAAVPPGDHASP